MLTYWLIDIDGFNSPKSIHRTRPLKSRGQYESN
ncbi:hypothetical protein Vca1114GL_00954 [Vibrio campbellii]|nr:hypothetical protein Vca1114GL_00954 [Vibrio campbellii]